MGRATYGGIAQLVEHLLCKQGVIGSSPFTSTTSEQAADHLLPAEGRKLIPSAAPPFPKKAEASLFRGPDRKSVV